MRAHSQKAQHKNQPRKLKRSISNNPSSESHKSQHAPDTPQQMGRSYLESFHSLLEEIPGNKSSQPFSITNFWIEKRQHTPFLLLNRDKSLKAFPPHKKVPLQGPDFR
ncbi:hypothetical protein NPIL_374621 [Nephila pilipes]|uniref:Uncharacterized protein n=1 Tax=Nephila pilipes TaxID=299642 RepID=A0A8X6N3X3_NEPPI|nr:hypothetical protein NPIL_374621 [Nephila pilipes]